MPTPIITDGTMDKLIRAPRVVIPTGSALFKERAARFDALAEHGEGGAYLPVSRPSVQWSVRGVRCAGSGAGLRARGVQ